MTDNINVLKRLRKTFLPPTDPKRVNVQNVRSVTRVQERLCTLTVIFHIIFVNKTDFGGKQRLYSTTADRNIDRCSQQKSPLSPEPTAFHRSDYRRMSIWSSELDFSFGDRHGISYERAT